VPKILLCARCGDAFSVRHGGSPFCGLKCRFWSKVARGSECWVWTAGRDEYGYGAFIAPGLGQRAHRVAWGLDNGPAGDLDVLHHCDNPPCVRPSHLFLGTQADNVRDCKSKNRQAKGTDLPQSKLTPDRVRAVRAARASGQAYEQIARENGVSRRLVFMIVRRTVWAHVS
jgi:hypothetical protein